LFTVFLQLALVYLPVMNSLFGTRPLSFAELAATVLVGSVVFIAVEIEKGIRRNFRGPRRALRVGNSSGQAACL
jgi:Ca2+-transporting ATPase